MFKYALTLVAVAVLLQPAAARAETDAETCDRLAAFPDDPDKPAGAAGNRYIPGPDIATAVKACKAAASAAGAPRRLWFELGRAYEFGHEPARAVQAYRNAVDMGSTSAMVGLGAMQIKGSGVKANPAAGRALIERAAAAGNPAGMSDLGALHGAGIGGPVDFAKARTWFAKAAAANYPEAMFQMGMMTQDGDGGPKDDTAAKAWFEQAAALNHAGALERLGAYAEDGRAGPKDKTAAIAFYKKAAALGDDDAQEALRRLRCPYSLKDKNGKVVGSICYDGPD